MCPMIFWTNSLIFNHTGYKDNSKRVIKVLNSGSLMWYYLKIISPEMGQLPNLYPLYHGIFTHWKLGLEGEF